MCLIPAFHFIGHRLVSRPPGGALDVLVRGGDLDRWETGSPAIERDRMAQGEPNQLYWAGFFLFGPFPEENMFGFS